MFSVYQIYFGVVDKIIKNVGNSQKITPHKYINYCMRVICVVLKQKINYKLQQLIFDT